MDKYLVKTNKRQYDLSTEKDVEPTVSKRKKTNRIYSKSYLEFGFIDDGSEVSQPLCVICFEKLSNESMKPSKMKRHLETKHPKESNESIEFFKAKKIEYLKQKECIKKTVKTVDNSIRASYLVSLRIAQNKKPHTIGENLIIPAVMDICNLMFGEDFAKKVQSIPLSNTTVKRRIDEMADNVENQLIKKIKSSDYYSIQIDETTDISKCAQLLTYVRFIDNNQMKEEMLFCRELESNTTGEEIFNCLDEYVNRYFGWNNCIAVCSDGAASMTDKKSGLITRIKTVNPEIRSIHCLIHRQALASKKLSSDLNDVLDRVVKTVNFIKSRALNNRLFKTLCEEMGSEHNNLLLNSEVRWLSRGRVLKRVFDLKGVISEFLKNEEKFQDFENESFIAKVAYLADIFDQFNKLNLSLQSNDNILEVKDRILGFIEKLTVWAKRVNNNVFEMFNSFNEYVKLNDLSIDEFKSIIAEHLLNLKLYFEKYFSEILIEDRLEWIRNPFQVNIEEQKLTVELKDQLLELKCNESQRMNFKSTKLSEFWIEAKNQYPELALIAIKNLIPFPSTYLCESAFSSLTYLKNKYRSKLAVENDLRLALTKIVPDINELCCKKSLL